MENKRHESVSERTAELLRATVVLIKQEAGRFDMEFWARREGEADGMDYIHQLLEAWGDCGTTMCLGSFCLRLGPEDFFEAVPWLTIEEAAQNLLDLTDLQRDSLFILSHWPLWYRDDYYVAKNVRKSAAGMAEALDRRIEHFIRTGE